MVRRNIVWNALGLALLLGLLWMLIWSCAEPVHAEPLYAPGDSLSIIMTARDSLGVAVVPDTVRLFVYRLGAVVESTKTYPGTIAGLTGSPKSLRATYVIPSTWANPYDLVFVPYGEGDGIVDEWICTPDRVRVNALMDSIRAVAQVASVEEVENVIHVDDVDDVAQVEHVDNVDLVAVTSLLTEEITAEVDSVAWVGYVDTTRFVFRSDTTTVLDEVLAIDDLSDAAIDSIIAGIIEGASGAGSAEIDTCACDGCGVEINDTPVDLARVWIHSEETLRLTGAGRNVQGETIAQGGYWRLSYYPEGDYPDTIYVSAWSGTNNSWPLRGQRIIVADNSQVCP